MIMQLIGIFLVLLVPVAFLISPTDKNKITFSCLSPARKILAWTLATITIDGIFSLALWLPLVGLEFLF